MSRLIKKRKLSLHELTSILNRYLVASENDLLMILPISSTSLMIQRIEKNAKHSVSLKLLKINPQVLEKEVNLPKVFLVTPNNQ